METNEGATNVESPTTPETSANDIANEGGQPSQGPIPYDRFREVVEEKNNAKALAEQASQELQSFKQEFEQFKNSLGTALGGKQSNPYEDVPEELRETFQKLYPLMKERIFQEASQQEQQRLQQLEAERQAEEARIAQEEAEAEAIVQEITSQFSDDAELEKFKEFARKKVERYPTATLQGIFEDYKDAGFMSEPKSKITNSSNGRQEIIPDKPIKSEGFLEAGMRALREKA